MSDCEIQTQNEPIVMTEQEINDFKKYRVEENEKKERAQKKRLTKKGNPDKRSETSKENVSKARDKVKEYLSMSKAVMDEDTDEEYLDIVVKKKSKPQTKYMETKISVEPEPEPESETKKPEPKKMVAKRKPPTRKIEPETVPTVAEIKNPYSSMFGHTQVNVNAMRQKLALRF